MPYIIPLSNFKGHSTRSTLTNGSFSKTLTPNGLVTQDNGGVIEVIIDWITSNSGILISSIWSTVTSVIGSTFQALYTRIVRGVQNLYYFDWNATDVDLNNQINAIQSQIEASTWEFLGESAGRLVGGGAIVGGALYINKSLGLYLLRNAAPDIFNAWMDELGDWLGTYADLQASLVGLGVFLKGRSYIRSLSSNPFLSPLFDSLYGAGVAQNWGLRKGRRWSMQTAFNDIVGILPTGWESNLRSFLDGLGSSIVSTGFVTASAMDSWFYESLLLRGSNDSMNRQIIVYPDKDEPSESFILDGSIECLPCEISSIVATKKLLDNRGQGWSIEDDDLNLRDHVDSRGIEIGLEFFSFEKPPYYSLPRRGMPRTYLRVFNVNKNKLSWDSIKQRFGGAAFKKGRWRGQCNLTNGYKIWSYGDNPATTKTVLDDLGFFSTEGLVYPAKVERRRGFVPGDTSGDIDSNPVDQYLGYLHIKNHSAATRFEERDGIIPEKGMFQGRLPMYYDQEPSWFQAELSKLLNL